jgi:hypothetical protein
MRRAQLEEAQALAHLGSWTWDIPTGTLTWSGELYRIFGLDKKRAGGLVGRATVHGGRDSQAGFTLLSNAPVIAENLSTETRFKSPPLLLDHGVVSGMSVIIHARGRPYGVLGGDTTKQRKLPARMSIFSNRRECSRRCHRAAAVGGRASRYQRTRAAAHRTGSSRRNLSAARGTPIHGRFDCTRTAGEPWCTR